MAIAKLSRVSRLVAILLALSCLSFFWFASEVQHGGDRERRYLISSLRSYKISRYEYYQSVADVSRRENLNEIYLGLSAIAIFLFSAVLFVSTVEGRRWISEIRQNKKIKKLEIRANTKREQLSNVFDTRNTKDLSEVILKEVISREAHVSSQSVIELRREMKSICHQARFEDLLNLYDRIAITDLSESNEVIRDWLKEVKSER